MAKQQQDLESMLNSLSVAPDVNPIATKPNTNQQTISGGQFQVGEESKQVGRSSEESKYRGLAQIAGGVESSLDTFTKIVNIHDNRRINEAENEFDKIDLSNLTPQEKKIALDKMLKDVWTPMAGGGWKDKMGNIANKKWLSEEGLNSFEQERYQKDFVKFLNKPENLQHGDTPELERVFQGQYSREYPTAMTNTWFRMKSFDTGTKIMEKDINDALSMLPLSVNRAIRIPNQQEMDEISNGNTALQEAFKPFYDIKGPAILSKDPETYSNNIYNIITKSVMDSLDKDTPPEAMEAIARMLPRLAREKADEVWTAATGHSLVELKKSGLASMALATQQFDASSDKLEGSVAFVNSMMAHMDSQRLDPVVRGQTIATMVSKIVLQYDEAAETGKDKRLLEEFPEWNDMTTHERVNVGIDVLEQWIKASPDNQAQMDKFLGFKTSAETSKYITQEIRRLIYTSEAMIKETQADLGEDIVDIKFQAAGIANLKDSKAIDRAVAKAEAMVAKKLGISETSVRAFYRNPDGSMREDTDTTEWTTLLRGIKPPDHYKGSAASEFDVLYERGFTVNDMAGITAYMTGLREMGTNANTKKSSSSIDGGVFEGKKIKDQLDRYHAGTLTNTGDPRPSLAMDIITGKVAKNDEAKEAVNLVVQYRQARDSLRYNKDKMTPGQITEAEEFIATVDKEFARGKGETSLIAHYSEGLDRVINEAVSVLPGMIGSVPMASRDSPRPTDAKFTEMFHETREMIEKTLLGMYAVDLRVVPSQGKVIDKDGSWSKEARWNLVQAGMLARRVFASGGAHDDIQSLNAVFDAAYARLVSGNNQVGFITSPEGRYNLALIATLGKVYREQSALSNSSPLVHSADWFNRRMLMTGGWSDGSNVDEFLAVLSGPDAQLYMSQELRVPLMIADSFQGGKVLPGYELAGKSFGPQYVTNYNSTGLEVASAMGAQISTKTVTVDGNAVEVMDKNLRPGDMGWSAGKFKDTLNDAMDTSYTMGELAAAFRPMLTGIPQSTLDIMSEETQVQTAMKAVQAATNQRDGLLLDIVNGIFGKFGVNSSVLQLTPGETKLHIFANMLQTAAGMQNRSLMRLETIGERTSVSSVVPMVVDIGHTTAPTESGNTARIPHVQNGFFVQGPTAGESWSGAAFRFVNNAINFSPDGQHRVDGILQELTKEYPPGDIFVNGELGVGDSIMWQVGATAMSTEVPDDNEAKFDVISNWAKEHGYQSLNDIYTRPIFERRDPLFTLTATRDTYQRITETAASVAIRETFATPGLTLHQMLETINSKYLSYGGSRPLFDPKEFKPKEPGFATLVQDAGTFPTAEAKIPTFSWAHRSLDGSPRVRISDSLFSSEVEGQTRIESDRGLIRQSIQRRRDTRRKLDIDREQKLREALSPDIDRRAGHEFQ